MPEEREPRPNAAQLESREPLALPLVAVPQDDGPVVDVVEEERPGRSVVGRGVHVERPA